MLLDEERLEELVAFSKQATSSKGEESYLSKAVFWDDTNVSFLYKPSGADGQRLTYSSQYGENCAKGGVFYSCVVGWE
eukprot:5802333-Ditylum_brightwellii.AAC.1